MIKNLIELIEKETNEFGLFRTCLCGCVETIEGLEVIFWENIEIFTEESGLRDILDIKICLIFTNETRNSYYKISKFNSNEFRKEFYKLYPGNWNFKIADLGDLPPGKSVEDTYFALSEICRELKQTNIIPVIIGEVKI